MKSWKTTLLGILSGILFNTATVIQDRQTNPNAPPITFHNTAPAIAFAILGVLSKDYDKSNSPNPVITQKVDTPK